MAGVGEQRDRVQKVEDDDRLEDVELEIALRAGEADGGVVAHDLDGDHGDGFALGGIDFAGHDGRARLVFGNDQFAEAAAWAGGEPANVVGDLHQRSGQRFECAVAKTISSWAERAANLLGCERKGRPVSSAIFAAARSANSG